ARNGKEEVVTEGSQLDGSRREDPKLQSSRRSGLHESACHDDMRRRQPAHWIGSSGVAGQQEGLTTTAAEVDLAPVAAPTRFRHPVGAAKTLEYGSIKPDVFERAFADIGKRQSRNLARRLAGQDSAVGRHGQEDAAPAVQTGLGIVLKVIG